MRELDDEFFRLYETATNGLITRQYIDPDEQPALAQRYGVTEDGDRSSSPMSTPTAQPT